MTSKQKIKCLFGFHDYQPFPDRLAECQHCSQSVNSTPKELHDYYDRIPNLLVDGKFLVYVHGIYYDHPNPKYHYIYRSVRS